VPDSMSTDDANVFLVETRVRLLKNMQLRGAPSWLLCRTIPAGETGTIKRVSQERGLAIVAWDESRYDVWTAITDLEAIL
jgi:hypothetical protein